MIKNSQNSMVSLASKLAVVNNYLFNIHYFISIVVILLMWFYCSSILIDCSSILILCDHYIVVVNTWLICIDVQMYRREKKCRPLKILNGPLTNEVF